MDIKVTIQKKHEFLHHHQGLTLNPGERHSVVDEADRLEAIEKIARIDAALHHLNMKGEAGCDWRAILFDKGGMWDILKGNK